MIIKNNIPNKGVYSFKAWTLGDEKRTIMGMEETDSLYKKIEYIFANLIGEEESLNYEEKLYILLNMKSKISDNNINISYTCENCKQHSEANIKLDESLHLTEEVRLNMDMGDITFDIRYAENLEDGIVGIPKEHIEDLLNDMHIDKYDTLEDTFYRLNPQFEMKGIGKCLICGHEVIYTPPKSDMINMIMTLNLMTYYDTLVSMKQHGFSISEIEGLMPFELELITSTIIRKMKNSQG